MLGFSAPSRTSTETRAVGRTPRERNAGSGGAAPALPLYRGASLEPHWPPPGASLAADVGSAGRSSGCAAAQAPGGGDPATAPCNDAAGGGPRARAICDVAPASPKDPG